MEDPTKLRNRTAATRPPGRPSAEEIANRAPPAPVERVRVPKIVYEDGFVCPVCGQAQKPHVRKVDGGKRYLQCGKCDRELVHDLVEDTVQPLRRGG